MSLLDNQMKQSEDKAMTPQSESDNAALNELTLTVKVMASNYATKEELAVLKAKVDAMPAQIELALKTHIDQAFKTHTEMMYKVFATKEELATAINLQTWRMAAFGSLLLSAGFAFARFL
jgi:2',3'-cyclic-nucleotide 2'-phosphodiesterase (5'-nucleotidase family)